MHILVYSNKMDFNKLMEYQNLVQTRLRQEQTVDKKIDLLSLINQLTSGPKNIVQKELIIVEATYGVNRFIIDHSSEQINYL